MTNIRVDPSHLRDVAQQLDAIVDRVRTLGNEANQITLNTPSYDGQFGPKARALGMEAEARLVAQARRLSSLSEELVVRAAAFEAVDRETLTAFDQLTEVLQSWMDQASLVLSPLVRLANFPWERINRYLRLGLLIEDPGDGEEEDEDEEEDEKVEDDNESLGSKVVLGASDFWSWYDRTINQPIYSFFGTSDILGQAYQGGENLLNLIAITQYQTLMARNAPSDYLRDYVFLIQEPGLPPDGPVTVGLEAMAATDPSGDPISIVGREMADLIAQREIRVSFIMDGGGASPWTNRIFLADRYINTHELETPSGTGLLAHELTHSLQRELDDPHFWPSGEPRLSEPRSRLIGDSTNYMEVLAYIVGDTVEYDMLAQIPSPSRSDIMRMDRLANDIATLTNDDALNATRYVVRRYNYVDVYKTNYTVEMGVPDHRIPDGGWDHWLREMGFSDEAINHIIDIASTGTVEHVDPDLIDPANGVYSTPTPSPTPTSTPTSTPTPSSTSPPTTPTSTPTGKP